MIAAYCWPQSAKTGEVIDLFCHTTADRFRIEIVRQGVGSKTVAVHERIPGREQALTADDDTPSGFEVLATAPARLWETEQAPDSLADNYIGELNWVAERLGGADTPENRQRFANGHAVLGTFRRGRGEIFTTGCTDWAYGLTGAEVSTVTTNVLDRFIRNHPTKKHTGA